MKLIVGLGNPGKQYRTTRHNIGFLCVEHAAHNRHVKFKHKRKFKAEIAMDTNALWMKPQTYMNLSGESVRAVMDFYQIAPQDILVIHDDLDLPLGKLRLRQNGGTAGHKGLNSIIDHIHTDAFNRLKFGIGRHEHLAPKDYVLQHFSEEEVPLVKETIQETLTIMDKFLQETPIIDLMNHHN